ncbi:MAG TPA: hypothetical protein VFS77_09505 [Pyrinomonadaceae bacterium]|nr:hypothetical protein [Pyrinomonadaceae bacterium]
MKQIRIRSYFSIPTDLAEEMRHWSEFVSGQDYSVDLSDSASGDAVSVRYVEVDEDDYVTIEAANSSLLFDKVVGRVICALAAHSDNLMINNYDRQS